ncbi:uncharacterized protein RB166_011668 [Leptodactylus fuscus]
MLLYTLLCLYIWRLPLVTSCTSEILQEPDKIIDVRLRSPVQFNCTVHGTCDVGLMSIEASNIKLKTWDSSRDIIPNQDIEVSGSLTKFTVTIKPDTSDVYYCAATVLENGKPKDVKSKGTEIILEKGAGMAVCESPKLIFVALIFLVCITAGI